uniref:Uncharacterized protein n=1 Tax=Anopheles farauti TaxID=69004 RepID=A0A182Q3R0_9DIPT
MRRSVQFDGLRGEVVGGGGGGGGGAGCCDAPVVGGCECACGIWYGVKRVNCLPRGSGDGEPEDLVGVRDAEDPSVPGGGGGVCREPPAAAAAATAAAALGRKPGGSWDAQVQRHAQVRWSLVHLGQQKIGVRRAAPHLQVLTGFLQQCGRGRGILQLHTRTGRELSHERIGKEPKRRAQMLLEK